MLAAHRNGEVEELLECSHKTEVEVDGVPRHILDLKLIQGSSENDGDTE